MAPAGIRSLHVPRGVVVVAVLCSLVLLSSLFFLPSRDASPSPPIQPRREVAPPLQRRSPTSVSALESISVLCSMGGEHSSWCQEALQSSTPLSIVSGATSVKELVLVAECLALGSECEERSILTVLIAEDPRNVAADCIAHGELEREECVRMMHAHAEAFARLFELGGRNNLLRVTEGGDAQVYRDRHWFVCSGGQDGAEGSVRCVLVLDYIDLSERPDTSSVALERFLQGSPMSGSGLQLAAPPPHDRVFSSIEQYGRYWDILTREECDLVPASTVQSTWMTAHGYYRHDQRTVVGTLFYYTGRQKEITTAAKKKKAQALAKRMSQARAFVNSLLSQSSRLEVLIVAFVMENKDGSRLPDTLTNTLEWIAAQKRVTLDVRTELPDWFNVTQSYHFLKGEVLTHDLMTEADVAVFHDLDTLWLGAGEMAYCSPRHLRMKTADRIQEKENVTAEEWQRHEIPESNRVHHTVAVDGSTAPYFWYNSGLMAAPGFIMKEMGWETIERANALSPELATRDMFAVSFAYHRVLPPFSPLPMQVNFNIRTWIRELCELVHAPIVSVHYHSLVVTDGAPALVKKPKRRCAVYEGMLEEFDYLREHFQTVNGTL